MALHGISVFYSNAGDKGTVEFLASVLIYYTGYVVALGLNTSAKGLRHLLKYVNYAFIILATLALVEFSTQINILDSMRNCYQATENQFNANLGMVRLGRKAAMGPFSSTLPFAYTLVSLFFLCSLHRPKLLFKERSFPLGRIIWFLGILSTFLPLSRAAIFVLMLVGGIRIFLLKKLSKILLAFVLVAIVLGFSLSKSQNTAFGEYLERYVYTSTI
ncbi:hypothetical protein N9594_00760, partial [bacterium]|nr:hypothetical protein [bacterium]